MTTTTRSAQPTKAKLARAHVGARVGVGVVVGVDTHQLTHTAAVIDTERRRLVDRTFPATAAGYRELCAWAAGLDPAGRIARVGVESTGSYGAGLTRHLLTAGPESSYDAVEIVEVQRPEKATRVKHGKSDPIDAYSAAEQALTGHANGHPLGQPKIKTGVVEAIRAIKVPRDAAVKNRTAAFSQLRDLVTTAPDEIHDALIGRTSRRRVAAALAMRPDPARLHEPAHAVRYALRALARRVKDLDTEIKAADKP